MPTSLSERKSKLVFATSDHIRDRGKLRAVVIEATPYAAMVRLQGTRTSFTLPYSAIYHLAARLAANEARREKLASGKKARR